MKEYMPGQGSYKVEEAGTLTGIDTSYDVDNNWGTLVFNREDVKIKARGLDIALSSKFNSDHLYSIVIPKISKGDGPSTTSRPIPNSLITLPASQANFYRIANGWSWNLPFIMTGTGLGTITNAGSFIVGNGYVINTIGTTDFTLIGAASNTVGLYFTATGVGSGNGSAISTAPNIFKFAPGNGKIFDLLSTITKETYSRNDGYSWTEGYEVTYSPIDDNRKYVKIVIPEIQITLLATIIKSGSDPFDYTPSAVSAYLSDGRVVTFNAKGFVSTITDAAGINNITYSYVTDSLNGKIMSSESRRQFGISSSNYSNCSIGDLIIIRDEIGVIFSKDGTVNGHANTISVSCKFDVATDTANLSYMICKGKLQKISHTDGRAIKLTYDPNSNNFLIFLSSDNTNHLYFESGDQFLGFYTIGTNYNLIKYQTINSGNHAQNHSDFSGINGNGVWGATQSTYFTTMQKIDYDYKLTINPSPSTDFITITNNVGAPTIYYFQKGGFCTHTWNNCFFHTGICRRGGTTRTLNIERPDFYIGTTAEHPNYININRIDQVAFQNASKDDYMRDEHEAEFRVADDARAYDYKKDSRRKRIKHKSGLWAAKMQHLNDENTAANAGNVSAWVKILSVDNANKITLSGSLVQAPRQNDIYAVIQLDSDPPFANQMKIAKTSRDSTRIYFDGTESNFLFTIDDYIFIRTECHRISAVSTRNPDTREKFGSSYYHWIEVSEPCQFVPLENEQVLFIAQSDINNGNEIKYYGYYLNKPKVVRIEIKDSLLLDKQYWKVIDYEYTYDIQNDMQTDDYEDGGFTIDNIEGPQTKTFEFSDISIKETDIITSIQNIDEKKPLSMEKYIFDYDTKKFHMGQSDIVRMRYDNEDNNWIFINKISNYFKRPCSNAGYYGISVSKYFEGDESQDLDDAEPRKTTKYKFDIYGRIICTKIISFSFEGSRIKSSWIQYVGSSANPNYVFGFDIDPLGKFSNNYYGYNYQAIINGKHALGIIGATIDEIKDQKELKAIYNGFDNSTLNLIVNDVVSISSLTMYDDELSVNNPNFRDSGGITDPSLIRWTIDGANYHTWTEPYLTRFSDNSKYDNNLAVHARTLFTYDENNNLITITKPLGNTINLIYGSSWKSSYIIRDFKNLNKNINNGLQVIVNNYDYDLKGRLITKTIRLNNSHIDDDDDDLYAWGNSAKKTKTEYTYDGMDRILSKTIGDDGLTQAQTQILAVVYYDNGDANWPGLPYLVVTDYLGFRTKRYYDARYRLVQIQKFKPDSVSHQNLTYSTDYEISIGSEQNIYDIGIDKVVTSIKFTSKPINLPVALNAPAPANSVVTRNTYDNIGRLLQIAWTNYDTSFGGTGAWKILKDIEYDANLNKVITYDYVDEDSKHFIQTEVINDWLGRGPIKEISYTDLNGGGTQRIINNHYRYDGKLIKKVFPNKDIYVYCYDNLGNLEKIIYPDGTRVARIYDSNGNSVQFINRRNLSTNIEYNQADLEIKRTTIDSERGDTVIETCHTQFNIAKEIKTENGLLVVENDFEYHISGEQTLSKQITDTIYPRSILFSYNVAGNKIAVTYRASDSASPYTKTLKINSQYHPNGSDTDTFNRVMIGTNDATPKLILTQEKNYLDLLSKDKFANGSSTSYTTEISHITHAYDEFLRLKSLISSEATPLLNITNITRDFQGNILSKEGKTYTYDGMGRLLNDNGTVITFDELSNIYSLGNNQYRYRKTGPNKTQMQLETFFDGSFTWHYHYDADGNVIDILNDTNHANDRFTEMNYDNIGNLREIVYKSGQLDKYWYNPKGLRIKKTEHFGESNPTSTYTLYFGEIPIIVETYKGSTPVIYDTQFNIIGE